MMGLIFKNLKSPKIDPTTRTFLKFVKKMLLTPKSPVDPLKELSIPYKDSKPYHVFGHTIGFTLSVTSASECDTAGLVQR